MSEYTLPPSIWTFWNWYLQGSIPSLNSLLREIFSNKKQEDIPIVRVIAYPQGPKVLAA